jgi:hypothetical protein
MSPFSRFLKPLSFIAKIPIAYVPHITSILAFICLATVTIVGAVVHIASYPSLPSSPSSPHSLPNSLPHSLPRSSPHSLPRSSPHSLPRRPLSIIETMKLKEEKETDKTTIFLLGDSMLDNTLYVDPNESVADIFKTTTDHNVRLFAKDGALIGDVYSQLHKINPDYNNRDTYICVSAGGNNILELVAIHLQYKAFNIDTGNEDASECNNVNQIFEQYKKLINAITLKLPNANILLLNLYYPTAEPALKPLIAHWNEKMDASFENVAKRIRVVRVDKSLTRPHDFTHRIEPSYEGGCKMVDLIKGAIQ